MNLNVYKKNIRVVVFYHGKTKKLVEKIAEECNINLINAVQQRFPLWLDCSDLNDLIPQV